MLISVRVVLGLILTSVLGVGMTVIYFWAVPVWVGIISVMATWGWAHSLGLIE